MPSSRTCKAWHEEGHAQAWRTAAPVTSPCTHMHPYAPIHAHLHPPICRTKSCPHLLGPHVHQPHLCMRALGMGCTSPSRMAGPNQASPRVTTSATPALPFSSGLDSS